MALDCSPGGNPEGNAVVSILVTGKRLDREFRGSSHEFRVPLENFPGKVLWVLQQDNSGVQAQIGEEVRTAIKAISKSNGIQPTDFDVRVKLKLDNQVPIEFTVSTKEAK